MPFIGNQPAEKYSSFQKQDFTTSATTSYTLDHPVANGNEIALFINFVRQEPTAAYTASGTSLTLTSATTSSDDMYCVYLGKAVQTVNPPNSSVGNSQLDVSAINSQTAETSIAGGDEVLIYDTSASALRKMTRTNFVSGIGGTNTPAFSAYLSSNQSISTASFTKIQFDTETYDTDGTYDNSTNYRFTPGVAGKYLIFANMYLNSLSDGKNVRLDLYKNGASIAFGRTDSAKVGSSVSVNFSYADSASTSDYYELFVYHNEGGSLNVASGRRTSFGANKIIE